MHPSWEDTAEKLTLQAVQAAEEGRWDTVDLCYQRRGELLRANDVSRSIARLLHSLDGHDVDPTSIDGSGLDAPIA